MPLLSPTPPDPQTRTAVLAKIPRSGPKTLCVVSSPPRQNLYTGCHITLYIPGHEANGASVKISYVDRIHKQYVFFRIRGGKPLKDLAIPYPWAKLTVYQSFKYAARLSQNHDMPPMPTIDGRLSHSEPNLINPRSSNASRTLSLRATVSSDTLVPSEE
jgi:hypothetical protein